MVTNPDVMDFPVCIAPKAAFELIAQGRHDEIDTPTLDRLFPYHLHLAAESWPDLYPVPEKACKIYLNYKNRLVIATHISWGRHKATDRLLTVGRTDQVVPVVKQGGKFREDWYEIAQAQNIEPTLWAFYNRARTYTKALLSGTGNIIPLDLGHPK